MARTDNDTWDLASSVGATATMVAAARAAASKGPDAIIDDQFAEPLVRAVGVDFFTKLATGELTPDAADGAPEQLTRFTDGMAARTRFFDDFFLDASRAGVRQAVILASGLDARAYRLSWPDGTKVFEIDQPEVIEFKTQTLADLGAEPTADRRTVAVDLRNDWPAALEAAGFDRTAPSAWIAEGLFGYLPPEAQDKLLDLITELSAPGSRLAAEGVPNIAASDTEDAQARMQTMSDSWSQHGFDLDFSQLVFMGDRSEVTSYLRNQGWTTTAVSAKDLLAKHGLAAVSEDEDQSWSEILYVSAEK